MSQSRRKPSLFALLLVALLGQLLIGPVAPAEAAPRKLMGGWITYWGTDQALSSFQANADLFSDVSPFWHALTGDRSISDQESAGDRDRVMRAARAAGVPVVPALTDGTGTNQLAAALADPSRRSTVVGTIVGLVASRGYDGIDLDLEGFAFNDPKSTWESTRPNWVAFVAELGGALHARGKKLFVTIPATYNSSRAAGSGYWVYDYAGIAPHADRVRIMAYDYSVSRPGPIAPYEWVRNIVAYAVTQIPSPKLVLGVATYGRDWVTGVSGFCPSGTNLSRRSVGAAEAWALASQRGANVVWNASTREREFAYQEQYPGCTVNRKVHFSDASAVMERARLVDEFLLAGVAAWRIGPEESQLWSQMRVLAANPWDPRLSSREDVEAFVAQAYRDVLGREADPGGLEGWTNALTGGSITIRQFAEQIVYSSEASMNTTAALYRHSLGRDPDQAGQQGWAWALSSKQVSLKDLRALFWACDERYILSGLNDVQWVRDLYRGELEREPDQPGWANWAAATPSLGRPAVAQAFVDCSECAYQEVTRAYWEYLKRAPDPAGLASWASIYPSSDYLVLSVHFVASAEYYNRATAGIS